MLIPIIKYCLKYITTHKTKAHAQCARQALWKGPCPRQKLITMVSTWSRNRFLHQTEPPCKPYGLERDPCTKQNFHINHMV